jgi:starch synthase
LKILLASSEIYPFAKTGGLADVAGALPKALKKIGVDVRVIMPKYKGIEEKGFPITYKHYTFSCPISQRAVSGEIVESEYDGIPAYLVEKDEYFYRDYLYSTPDGDYLDNAERFIFFSKSILEAVRLTGWVPDVLHCNDWQTGHVPLFLRGLHKDDPDLAKIGTLFTIHNMGYQGLFWHYDMHLLNLGWEYFTPECLEFYGKINFLKGGIVSSDIINTVSRKYSEEIQTPEFGAGLDGVLRSRKSDLYGIVNGVDYDDWSPDKDAYVPAKFTAETVGLKARDKAALQQAFGLPARPAVPLVASISRLADQKGFDLIADAFEEMMALDMQYILLGTGERKYHELFAALSKKYPKSFAVKIAYDNTLAHLIEAGADIFLMPSRYEPCGLNQIYSLKYGTVPVVRAVGGLEDTIRDDPARPGLATGFKFYDYSAEEMLRALKRALALHRDKDAWLALVKRCMQQDFSWEKSATEYAALYKKALEEHGFH